MFFNYNSYSFVLLCLFLTCQNIELNNKPDKLIDESIINNYFEYIKPKLGFESIFRLLSPLLSIFFSVPHSKIYRSKINDYMKDQKINLIEDLLIKFVSERNLS